MEKGRAVLRHVKPDHITVAFSFISWHWMHVHRHVAYGR